MLIENGLNIKAIQNRLGHKNVNTTLNIYAEVTSKSVGETKDVINEMYKTDILSANCRQVIGKLRHKKAPRKELFSYFKTAFKKKPAKPLHNAVIIDVTIKL